VVQRAIEVFDQLPPSYPGTSQGAANMQESFSLLEGKVRFVALLAAAAARSAGLSPTRIGRSPGLGMWISFLRSIQPDLDQAGTKPAQRVGTMIGEILEQYDRGIPAAPTGLRGVKVLRDHVTHGGALPDASAPKIRGQVNQLVKRISGAVTTGLADAKVAFQPADSRYEQVRLSWAGDEIRLWPYMYAYQAVPDGQPHMYVFASFMKASPTYMCFGNGDHVRQHPSDEILLAALREVVKPVSHDDQFETFVNAVQDDIQGFIESDIEPICRVEYNGFEYHWEKATSEGTEHRLDQFRLGPADVREWRSDDGSWVTYPVFLQTLAHWRTVATRLRQGLDQIEETLDLEERDSLGWEPVHADIRPAEVEVYDFDGGHRESWEFSSLFDSVDKDLQVNRGATQVIFINGEAGIGKTRAMVHAARRRAREVEAGADLPLFLYVRSTGHVLESLDTVVAAAVTSTRNLTEEAVRALCRNGLMTLFIDGFDELLGGVGYRDAIASLRPWLIALGGRGVLVVSARSSYYLGQYRSSLKRAQLDDDLNVLHRIADVKRWDKKQVLDFMADFSVPPERLDALSAPDRKLLGLPFFARAFAEMYRKDPDGMIVGVPLTERLLEEYLKRETAKLSTGLESSTQLLDHNEMRQLFELLAEAMASNEEREAGVEELEFLAAVVTDDEDLATRPRLRDRLTVLCGLAADTSETGRRRFRFQHELFFDQFLAGAAARLLSRGKVDQFFTMLRASQWRAATVMGVVTQADAENVADVLANYPSDPKSPVGAETAATNLGSLWAAIIEVTHQARRAISDAHFTEVLDLSSLSDVDLSMKDCQLSSLTLPTGTTTWRVALTRSTVAELTAMAPNLDLRGLTGIQHRGLLRMITAKKYLDRPTEIADELVKAGAAVIDKPQASDASGQSIQAQAAEWFLTRMDSNGANFVVLRADNLQPDANDPGRTHWTQDYGASAWSAFTHGLIDMGLASADPFPASGTPKKKFRLKAPIHVLLYREPAQEATEAAVERFWAKMRSK
jgi:hypothetical protein